MVKKSVIIERILDEISEYGDNQGFSFMDKLREMRTNYTLEQLIGLLHLYIVPAHKEGVLKEYIESELEKYRMVGKFMDLPEISLTDTQLDYLIYKLVQLIDLTVSSSK
jgi:hypothetical protein